MPKPARWDGLGWLLALLLLPACLSPAPRAPADPSTPEATTQSLAAAPASIPLTSPAGSSTLTGEPVDVFLDPGHGGVDDGAIGFTADGRQVTEKAVTLAIALRTAAILQAQGFRVMLSRRDDSLPGLEPEDLTPEGDALTPEGVLHDLQRRIDAANASGARVLLSIHFNSFDDPSVGGAETIYDSARPFAVENMRFAQLIQQHVVAALRAAGYPVDDRGVIDDSVLRGGESLGAVPASYGHLVLLGPELPGYVRPSQMPGALSEPLFLSNPEEATMALDPTIQQALAQAYADAIAAFLRGEAAH